MSDRYKTPFTFWDSTDKTVYQFGDYPHLVHIGVERVPDGLYLFIEGQEEAVAKLDIRNLLDQAEIEKIEGEGAAEPDEKYPFLHIFPRNGGDPIVEVVWEEKMVKLAHCRARQVKSGEIGMIAYEVED